ncbi:unnamed protein product, partial [Prorocentrum cordatum]
MFADVMVWQEIVASKAWRKRLREEREREAVEDEIRREEKRRKREEKRRQREEEEARRGTAGARRRAELEKPTEPPPTGSLPCCRVPGRAHAEPIRCD